MTMNTTEFQVSRIAYGDSVAVYLLLKSYNATEAVYDYVFFGDEDSGLFTKATAPGAVPNLTDPVSRRVEGLDQGGMFSAPQTSVRAPPPPPPAAAPAAAAPAAPPPVVVSEDRAPAPFSTAPARVGVVSPSMGAGSRKEIARQRRYAQARGQKVPTGDKPYQFEYQLPEDDPNMPGATIQPGMGDRAARTMAAAAGGSARALMGLPRKVRDWAKGLQQEAKDYSRHKKDKRALADLLIGASPEEHERFREVYGASLAANRAAKNKERAAADPARAQALEAAFQQALFPSRETSAEFLALSPEDRQQVLHYDDIANSKAASPEVRQLARDRILSIYNSRFGPDEQPDAQPDAQPEEEDDGLGEEQAGLEAQLPKDNEGGVGVRRVANARDIAEAQDLGETVAAPPPAGGERETSTEPITQVEPEEEEEESPEEADTYDGYDYGHRAFPAIAGVGEEGDEDYVAGRSAIDMRQGAASPRIYDYPMGMDRTAKRRQMLSRLGHAGNIGGQLRRDQLIDPATGEKYVDPPFSSKYKGLMRSHTANMLEGMRDPDTGGIFSMTDDGEIDFKETEKRYNEEVANYINYLKSMGVDDATIASKVTKGTGRIKPFSGRGSFLDSIAQIGGANERDPAVWEYDPLEGPQETMAEFPDEEGAESYAVRPSEAALYDLLPNVHGVGRDAFLAQRKAQGFDKKRKPRTRVRSSTATEEPAAAKEGTTEETDAFDMNNPELTSEETTPQLAGNVADLIAQREGRGTPLEMAANEPFAAIRDSLGENFAEVLDTPTGEDVTKDPLLQAVMASDATPLINYLRGPLMDAANSLTDNMTEEQREKTLMEGGAAVGKRINEVKAYYKQMLENESQLGKSDDPLDRAFDTFFKEEW